MMDFKKRSQTPGGITAQLKQKLCRDGTKWGWDIVGAYRVYRGECNIGFIGYALVVVGLAVLLYWL